MKKSKEERIAHEFSLMLYWLCKEFKKCTPSQKGLKLIYQAEGLIKKYSNPLHALRSDGTETVGSLISEAMQLHELEISIVEKEIGLPKGVLQKLMSDEYYTNSVPIVLFKNLVLSLHIPVSKIEAAIMPTFHLLLSKETPETINKKPPTYHLWENEEAVMKYITRLVELMSI